MYKLIYLDTFLDLIVTIETIRTTKPTTGYVM